MTIVLKNGTLIDGNGKSLTNADVVLEGERIQAAGPSGSLLYPKEAELIDVAGMTILPGLMDVHAHFHGDASPDRFEHDAVGESKNLLRETDAYIAAMMGQNARVTLEAGFTTIRDLGGPRDINIDVARAVKDGLVKGPKIFAAATIDISVPAGKLLTHGVEGGNITGPVDARRATRVKLGSGADVIHVRATGAGYGQWESDDELLSIEEMEAAITEAHKFKRRTAANACGSKGIRNAVVAGVQSIEHGWYLHEDDDLIKLMVDRETGWVPTFMVSIMKRDKNREAAAKGQTTGIPDFVVKREIEMIEHGRRSFEKAMKAGMLIGHGTDVGAAYMVHGKNAVEMEQFVKYGATPMQAIEAATRVNAKIMRIDDHVGTIEAGKQADVIVVKGDPLKDIRLLLDSGNIILVYKAGAKVADRRLNPLHP